MLQNTWKFRSISKRRLGAHKLTNLSRARVEYQCKNPVTPVMSGLYLQGTLFINQMGFRLINIILRRYDVSFMNAYKLGNWSPSIALWGKTDSIDRGTLLQFCFGSIIFISLLFLRSLTERRAVQLIAWAAVYEYNKGGSYLSLFNGFHEDNLYNWSG